MLMLDSIVYAIAILCAGRILVQIVTGDKQ